MREADLSASMRLKTLAGWNQTEADWRFFLKQRPEGCFVAEQDGQVIGTVTTASYGPRLAWISMLLVDPHFRKRGIGTRLMEAAIDSLAGWTTIALDATPAGQPLYERLGFRAEAGLARLFRPGASGPDGFGKTCPVFDQQPRPVDMRQVATLDRAAFGADRTALFESLHERALEAAGLAICRGRPTGFCLGRHGSRFSQLGPVVAGTVEQAMAVCRAALAVWEGRALVLDVPASQETFLAWLYDQGFEFQRPFTRMSCGARLPTPTGLVHTFAICGPEFG